MERSPDVLLDALLEGGPLPAGDPARWRPVAQVLTGLTSAPDSSELTAESQALAEFRSRPRPVQRPGPAYRRDPGRVTWLRGPRPAVAAAMGAVLMGGLLAVAYAGDLPASVQRLAHNTIDAPAAGRPGSDAPQPDASARPVPPVGTAAGQASSSSGHGSAHPDRRVPHGSWSGSPRHHRPSRSASGTPGGSPSGRPEQGRPGQGRPEQGRPGQGRPEQGRPGQGSPGRSPTPTPTQQPSPSASTVASAGGTQSPYP